MNKITLFSGLLIFLSGNLLVAALIVQIFALNQTAQEEALTYNSAQQKFLREKQNHDQTLEELALISSSPEALEKEIRESLPLVKPGEVLLVVSHDEAGTSLLIDDHPSTSRHETIETSLAPELEERLLALN